MFIAMMISLPALCYVTDSLGTHCVTCYSVCGIIIIAVHKYIILTRWKANLMKPLVKPAGLPAGYF